MAVDSSFGVPFGVLGVAASTGITLLASIVEECLKGYHRSNLFELLPEPRRERFESYLKREDEYFFVARLLRSVAYLGCLFGLLVIFGDGERMFSSLSVLEAMAGTVVMAVLFAGIVPAVWARHATEKMLIRSLPLVAGIASIFRPLLSLSNALHSGVQRVRGDQSAVAAQTHEFEEDIADSLDEAARDGVISEDERKMISSALDFPDEIVESIMTPRTEIVGVSVNDPVAAAIDIANSNGHSRLPVFESANRDRILGVFYVRDAVRYWHARERELPPMRELMRQPLFVPESKKLIELLAEFRAKRTHFAVVLDEFGGTAGIVTMEDMFEEIVGDLQDEFDDNERQGSSTSFRHISAHVIEVDARMKVDDLNAEFKCNLPESEEYTSVGGLVAAHLGRIPRTGEKFPLDGIIVKVMEANERSVRKLRVMREHAAEQHSS